MVWFFGKNSLFGANSLKKAANAVFLGFFMMLFIVNSLEYAP